MMPGDLCLLNTKKGQIDMTKPHKITKIKPSCIGKLYVIQGYVFGADEITKITKETHPEYFL